MLIQAVRIGCSADAEGANGGSISAYDEKPRVGGKTSGMTFTKTACLLSRSAIADDPRVRRQGNALHAAGWRVRAFGLAGGRSDCPAWMASEAEEAPPVDRGGIYRVLRRTRLLPIFLSANLSPAMARQAAWSLPGLRNIYRRAADLHADIWLANDWDLLPVAARLAEERGGKVVYDSHEFATRQQESSRRWRLLFRPMVRAAEETFIRKVALVTTVSDGIAGELQALYGIDRPLVIRSMPTYREIPFHATGETVRVLYHGTVGPTRKLEQMIDSVTLWRSQFTLTIRGPGDAAYLAGLQGRIRALGLEDRVTLAPPVPMTALVEEASAFDVGLFVFGKESPQKEYVLPNKFFEYVMAGLALSVSDLPEMARLVRQYDLGVLVDGFAPQAIAGAINSLTPQVIDGYKKNALAAARTLNWDCESRKLIEACERVAAHG